MSEYLKSLSDEQVADMREHFYKLGWGQNETMWKCWNQALDYLAPQLSASQAREATQFERIHQFDRCISAIATALGSPACGGVDEPSSPLGTAEVLVGEIKKLSVTSILLRVDPGNGDGEEIYAKSVADVEAELTRLDSQLEDWELGIKIHPELARKLEAAELALLNEGATHGETKMHLRNLEARIDASQGQEPVAVVGQVCIYPNEYGKYRAEVLSVERLSRDAELFVHPTIPPELAELQRENAELRKLLESKVSEEALIEIVTQAHMAVGLIGKEES